MYDCPPPPLPPIRRRVEQHCPGADYWRCRSPRLGMQKEADPPDSSAKKKEEGKKGIWLQHCSFRDVSLLRSPQAGGRSEVIWSTSPLQLAICCRVRSSDRGEHGRLEYLADSTPTLAANSEFSPRAQRLKERIKSPSRKFEVFIGRLWTEVVKLFVSRWDLTHGRSIVLRSL